MGDSDKKTIISLFAHPDDELGAIGTLANHVERGDNVIMAWTTYGELTTLLPELTIEEVKKERAKHMEEIGKIVGADKIINLDLGDSMVNNSREQKIKVAKMYVEEKPDAVISWGLQNSHPDHRNTGYLALDAIKFARINRIMETEDTHRENVKLLSYYEKGNGFSIRYVDIPEVSMEKAKTAAHYYGEIYEWEHVDKWAIGRRETYGREANTKYAEKFNIRFNFNKPSQYVI